MNSSPDSTSFPEFAKLTRKSICDRISAIFQENRSLFVQLPEMGAWLAEQMEDFASSGKMLRGTLAFVGCRLFNGPNQGKDAQIISLAAGLELLQAGLLVHDDIMDHDELRRGKPTCHLRIKSKILEKNPNFEETTALEMAEAQGICVGDLFFFIAWQEINNIEARVSALVAKEHAIVTLAQMRDVAMGYDEQFPTIAEVIEVYRHKTARYTVVLPLVAGAALSRTADTESQRLLEAFGEALGIVFQLQDDRLGLFGNEQYIGKALGSDMKEGKKTPYIIALQNSMDHEERARFDSIYRSPHIDVEDIEWLRNLIVMKGVDAFIEKIIQEHLSKARSILKKISKQQGIQAPYIHLLESFIDYSEQRRY